MFNPPNLRLKIAAVIFPKKIWEPSRNSFLENNRSFCANILVGSRVDCFFYLVSCRNVEWPVAHTVTTNTVAGGIEILLYVSLLQPPARAGVLDSFSFLFSLFFFSARGPGLFDWQVSS